MIYSFMNAVRKAYNNLPIDESVVENGHYKRLNTDKSIAQYKEVLRRQLEDIGEPLPSMIAKMETFDDYMQSYKSVNFQNEYETIASQENLNNTSEQYNNQNYLTIRQHPTLWLKKCVGKKIMKKRFTTLMTTLITLVFISCSSENTDESQNEVTYKINSDNIVGVWRANDNKFISFSSDKFNSSLLSNTFIDEGDYFIKGDTITVTNSYFNKTTRYVVNSINNETLSVSINYIDPFLGEQSSTIIFKKTTETPCSKNHELVGKSYYAQYNTNSGSQHWNKVFLTYNILSCNRQDIASSYPSSFYYIYLRPKMFFYVIRNNDYFYDTVRYNEIQLNEQGQIESIGKLYGESVDE